MDNTATSSPGTLAKFHLGLAADGTSCAMVFIDEQEHSIACIADFADLEGFITSLTQAAAEMARRRAALQEDDDDEAEEPATPRSGAINVASANFRICDEDGTIMGSLVGEGGQVVGIRMRADVANEMTRNMLRTARAVSTC
jgi:hypothetical protein